MIEVHNMCPNKGRAEQDAAPVVAYVRCGQCCLQRCVIVKDVGVDVENAPENVDVEAFNE